MNAVVIHMSNAGRSIVVDISGKASESRRMVGGLRRLIRRQNAGIGRDGRLAVVAITGFEGESS